MASQIKKIIITHAGLLAAVQLWLDKLSMLESQKITADAVVRLDNGDYCIYTTTEREPL